MATDRGTCGSVRSAAFQRCKKRANNIEMAAMRAFPNSVSEWCGRAVAARLLHGSCPVRFLPTATGSCPAPARFTAWFLPGSCPAAGSCPVRYLPDGRAGSASVGRRSGSSCAGAGQQNRPCTTLWCCTTLHLVRALPTVRGVGFTYYDRIMFRMCDVGDVKKITIPNLPHHTTPPTPYISLPYASRT